MKKFSAIVVALIVLCLSLVPMAASAADEKPLWFTHINENTVEGAGTIFTSEYSGAAWWIHFAFAPTNVKNVYTIKEISNGIADGSATPVAIPEGGFVYALNVGNDYATINNNPNDINYTSDGCNNTVNDVTTNWMVGMNIKFNGIDFDNLSVPTSTPDVMWYNDGYVCTATYSVYEGEVGAPDESSEDASEPSADESEASEPTDESSVDESSVAASTAESSVASSTGDSSAADSEGGLGGWLWVIIIAAVVVVAAVVAVVVKKKK